MISSSSTSSTSSTPRRLVDHAADEREKVLAAHFRNLAPPVPLSPEQVDRIERGMSATSGDSPRRRRVVWAPALALGCALLAWQLGRTPAPGDAVVVTTGRHGDLAPPVEPPRPGPPPPQPSSPPAPPSPHQPAVRRQAGRPPSALASSTTPLQSPRSLTVAAGETAVLVDDGQARLVLMGPGDVKVPRGEAPPSVTLSAGQLAVRTGDREQAISTAGHTVTVRARSVAEIEVHSSQVRVACYSGSVAVASRDAAGAIDVRAGSLLTSSGVERTDANRQRVIERLVLAPPRPVPIDPAPAALAAPMGQEAPRPQPALVGEGRVALSPPAPKRLHEEVAVPAVAAPPGIRVEAGLLKAAVEKLRRDNDAKGAITLIESYRAQFPGGVLRPESDRLLVEALVTVGRRQSALALLDRMAFDPRAERELAVTRGELRGEVDRCEEARSDFDGVIVDADDLVEQRALYGRATCAARLGDTRGARATLESYLARFPEGAFAAAARRQLEKVR